MKKIILVILVVILGACSHQRFNLTNGQPMYYPYEDKSHFFIAGLGQRDNININEICGDKKVEAIETNYNFVDGIINLFTYGIYTPRSYSVWCK